jgi:hypothetical protein
MRDYRWILPVVHPIIIIDTHVTVLFQSVRLLFGRRGLGFGHLFFNYRQTAAKVRHTNRSTPVFSASVGNDGSMTIY